jgi:hypothetical protein
MDTSYAHGGDVEVPPGVARATQSVVTLRLCRSYAFDGGVAGISEATGFIVGEQ